MYVDLREFSHIPDFLKVYLVERLQNGEWYFTARRCCRDEAISFITQARQPGDRWRLSRVKPNKVGF